MISVDRNVFKDEHGRTLVLRGVNLGGSSKVPFTPDGATWRRQGFYDHRQVSFIGRPFPLADADEHFARLAAWGFTFLRFLVTWEAVEHAGPGLYDQAYLEYLRAVIQKAGEHGISVFIDPHQDVWSRFSGGDGAPGWTLEAVGFDLRRLHATGAAFLHPEHGDPYPCMIWPTNAGKLACGTMFTLFFGGSDFAPQLQVDGVPVQTFLQGHFINAFRQVAAALRDLPNVVGYDTLNEPLSGFIGEPDVRLRARGMGVLQGEMPTMLQGMLLGCGQRQRVDVYALSPLGFVRVGRRVVDPHGQQAWLPGRDDIWKQHGVWSLDRAGRPVVHRPDHFSQVDGRPVDFHRDYFKPFANRFAAAIRSEAPGALLFVEGVPSRGDLTWGEADADRIVHAPHWYDGLTLYSKRYISWMGADVRAGKVIWGTRQVRASFTAQVARIMRESGERMNHVPTLIGETGIPFDLGRKKAYRSGDFSRQVRALDATMQALERNFASFTLWDYTADNTNARGDQWNDEDLSLFSRNQMTGSGSIHDGGRALAAAVRPYPRCVAGEPLSMTFDIDTRLFEFSFRHEARLQAPTEIFLPAFQYPDGIQVELSDGAFELDAARQCLVYRHTPGRDVHWLRLRPRG